MTSPTSEALGQVVQELRKKHKLTQEQLGRKAGYQGGAGVTISRLETGQMSPSPERFEAIASALDLSAAELTALVVSKSRSLKEAGVTGEDRLARGRKLLQEHERRRQLVDELDRAFLEARDRARTSFLMRLVTIAARIDGAPAPAPTPPVAQEGANAEAAHRLQFTKIGVAQALAEGLGAGDRYDAFAQAVVRGTLALGPTVSGLGSSAALKGLLGAARVGKPNVGVSAGAGAVGVVALIGGVIGALGLAKQRSRQQRELAAKLDELEDALSLGDRGVRALEDLMPQATELLGYIAVHATHALGRWEARIGEGELVMEALSEDDQRSYQDFVEIAAAQLAVEAIDFQDMMTSSTTGTTELEQAVALTEELLAQSREVVMTRV